MHYQLLVCIIALHVCWCFPPSHFSPGVRKTVAGSLCRQSQQSILPSDTQTQKNTHTHMRCGHCVDVSCIQMPLIFWHKLAWSQRGKVTEREGEKHHRKDSATKRQCFAKRKLELTQNAKMWIWIHGLELKKCRICCSGVEEMEKKCAAHTGADSLGKPEAVYKCRLKQDRRFASSPLFPLWFKTKMKNTTSN